MAGVLKARVGAEWVPIVGSGMSAETARWNSAWGVVAEGTSTADQGGITGTVIALNNLSVTFSPVVGRRYIYRAKVEITGTAAGDVPVLSILDGAAAVFDRHTGRLGGTATETWAWTSLTETFATTTAVTRRLALVRAVGSGTLTASAGADRPSKFMVEDVGPTIYNAAPTPVQYPTPWTAMTLLNGWTAYAGSQAPQYRKIGDIVYLRGSVAGGSAGPPITVMPDGYRPPASVYLLVQLGSANQTSYVGCTSSGGIAIPAGSATTFVALDGVFFSTI